MLIFNMAEIDYASDNDDFLHDEFGNTMNYKSIPESVEETYKLLPIC